MSGTTDIAAQATLTGASALFVTLLGIEPQAIVWSIVGSILGVTLAKPSGRLYAMALFIAATLACALLGTIAGDWAKPGSTLVRNGFAVVFAAGFHPILSAFIGMVPELIASAVKFFRRRFMGEQ